MADTMGAIAEISSIFTYMLDGDICQVVLRIDLLGLVDPSGNRPPVHIKLSIIDRTTVIRHLVRMLLKVKVL